MKVCENHKPFTPALVIGKVIVEPKPCAKQFCRRAPCAPQVKAIASHKVKRFQKRCRCRSRGSESLRRITPLSQAIGEAADEKGM